MRDLHPLTSLCTSPHTATTTHTQAKKHAKKQDAMRELGKESSGALPFLSDVEQADGLKLLGSGSSGRRDDG